MSKLAQNSFVGGELSPALTSRVDLAAYFKGAQLIENFIVRNAGGVYKRPGIVTAGRAESSVQDIAGRVKMVPYYYDHAIGGFFLLCVDESDYTEPTRYCYWFYTKSTDTGAYSYVCEGTFGSVEAAPVDEIDYCQIGDTVYICCGGNGIIRVAVTRTGTDEWAVAEEASHIQSSVAAPKISLSAAGNWGSSTDKTYSYCAIAVKDGRMSARATASTYKSTTWPAGATITVTVKNFPEDADYVLVCKKSAGAWCEIGRVYPEDDPKTVVDDNITSGTSVSPQTCVLPDVNTDGEAMIKGHVMACFQQRVVVAGAYNMPFSLYFSQTGNLYNYFANRPATATDAFEVTLYTQVASVIRHLVVYKEYLLVFTDEGVYCVTGQGEGFSGTACKINRLNNVGCSRRVRPVECTSGILFVGIDERTVYELKYDLSQDTLIPIDRTVLANHLTEGRRIVALAHQRYPESAVWALMDDGMMAVFSYQPEHEVYAWSRCRLMDEPGRFRITDIVAPGNVTNGMTDLVFLCEDANDPSGVLVMTLDHAANVDRVGLGSDGAAVVARLVTLPPEVQSGSVRGSRKNILDAYLRVRNTGRVALRRAENETEDVVVDASAGETYTGPVKITPRGVWDDEGVMDIRSDDGRPCEILSVRWDVEV